MSSFLFFSGRWIFQLPEVDFGARPNRLGHEVHYRWRAVWTGLLNVLVFNFNLICDAALCLSDWCFISYTTTCSDSPAWPETRWLRDCRHQWKQGWIHPVRKMLLLLFCFSQCVCKCSLMLTCRFVINSLVIQWRFVNRIQKQMTAFKEVNSGFVFLNLLNTVRVLKTHKGIKVWYTLCFRASLSWYRKIWSRSLMRMSSRWVFSWSN